MQTQIPDKHNLLKLNVKKIILSLKMDVVTMILIEYNLNIPLDVLIFLNGWLQYEELNNRNIKQAIELWSNNNRECRLKYGHISSWNTSKVTNMSCLFYYKTNFNEDISHWDVSNVTNMGAMFFNASLFNSDLSHWNVSNVTIMRNMFNGATSFNSDLSNWNVRNVLYMRGMFVNAYSFNSDLSQWNVRNVIDMRDMFEGASSFDRVRYSPKFPRNSIN